MYVKNILIPHINGQLKTPSSKNVTCLVCWVPYLIPALRRLRQEDHEPARTSPRSKQSNPQEKRSKRGKEFPVTFHIRHDYLVQMLKGRIIEQIFDHLLWTLWTHRRVKQTRLCPQKVTFQCKTVWATTAAGAGAATINDKWSKSIKKWQSRLRK